MQRRTLLKLGATSIAVLIVAGGASTLLQPGLQQGKLTAAGRALFSSVASAILQGTLPAAATEKQLALAGMLQRIDAMVQAFPPHVQAELSQLLGLLATGLGRRTLAGLATDWPDASIGAVQEALQSMRMSRLALRQQSYHALHDIVGAAYFSDASTWSVLGYPGPVTI
ncbi:hypothetical protein [Rhodoferax sp.]|uniref:hypothetical protein n=1 Tax=Rhodoferax sp. TaxID=50421 RepID=UPI001EC45495|nr:hypothetical protein [Rhodoferax sp.]MBT9505735.1 hypothetical protein [Rhodoferax sp.]